MHHNRGELSASELRKVHDNEPASRAVACLHQLQMADPNNRHRSSMRCSVTTPFVQWRIQQIRNKDYYYFCHINVIMVSDSDGFIVVCFEIQILFALHTKPNDKRHKLIQRLGPVKPKHEKRKRKLLERNRQWM